jgi:hypothetical protein
MKLKLKYFLTVLFLIGISRAQFDTDNQIKLDIDGFTVLAVYDSANFCSNLTVTSSDNKEVHKEECIERVSSIKADDLDSDGKKEILIETYTGGAHCCTSLYIARIQDKKFSYLDTIYWGSCTYTVEDLNKDGKKEIIGRNDMFAYFFTNFSMSRFPLQIYNLRKNKLKLVNKDFTSTIYKSINDLKEELKQYKTSGYECPKSDTADVFNTDAGAVQAILAAITADYFYIGEADKGYEYIDKVYSCPDKNKFIKILKNEFKLK